MYSYRESMLAFKTQIRNEADAERRKSLRNKRRRYLEQRGICCFCKVKMFLSTEVTTKAHMATREHIIPKSQGGTGKRENIIISCQRCNSNRGTVEFNLFKYIVETVSYEEMPRVMKSVKRIVNYQNELLFSNYSVLERRPSVCEGS